MSCVRSCSRGSNWLKTEHTPLFSDQVAGASPADTARAARVLGGAEEAFAFRRSVSRLHEMQTPAYLAGRPR